MDGRTDGGEVGRKKKEDFQMPPRRVLPMARGRNVTCITAGRNEVPVVLENPRPVSWTRLFLRFLGAARVFYPSGLSDWSDSARLSRWVVRIGFASTQALQRAAVPRDVWLA